MALGIVFLQATPDRQSYINTHPTELRRMATKHPRAAVRPPGFHDLGGLAGWRLRGLVAANLCVLIGGAGMAGD